tara:strand:- start:563 stop:751 length:189 start_codon:yes stop_codon:yes gene_type:complete
MHYSFPPPLRVQSQGASQWEKMAGGFIIKSSRLQGIFLRQLYGAGTSKTKELIKYAASDAKE